MDRKPGQNLDHVTIVTISGPKSRAQDGRVCGKWAGNLVRIWIMSGSVTRIFGPKVRPQNGVTCPKRSKKLVKFWVRCHTFVTSDKKTRSDPEMDQVKMALPALNGPKDARVLLAPSLAKQPPEAPSLASSETKRGAIIVLILKLVGSYQ